MRIGRSLLWLAGVGLLMFALIYLVKPVWLLRAEFARQAWQAGVTRHSMKLGDHRWVWFEREGTSARDDSSSGDANADGAAPLLLVHGFTGSKENFLPMLAELQTTRRVLAPDLPGWGESSRTENADYGIDAQVERLLTFMDAESIGRAHLAGHSMGGHIAGVFAALHPDRVASLTLIDNAGVHFAENAFAKRVLGGDTPFNIATRAEFDAFMAELFWSPPWLPGRLKDVMIERNAAGHAFHARVLTALGKGKAAFELERSLDRIHAPTLVLWCRQDRILDVSSTAVLARIRPAPKITVFDGCGHMAMMEQPAEFAAALRQHIESAETPAVQHARRATSPSPD